MPRSAYVFVNNFAGLKEMLMLSEFLRAEDSYDCSFVLSGNPAFLQQARDEVDRARFSVFLVGTFGLLPNDLRSKPGLEARMGGPPEIGFQGSSHLEMARILVAWYRVYRKQVFSARRFIRTSPPDILVFGAPGPGRGFGIASAREGARRNIPSLAIPVASFDKTAEVRALRLTPHYERMQVRASPINRLVSFLFPRLTASVDGEKVIFEWPPIGAMAAALARCEPPHRYWRSMSRIRTPMALRNRFEVEKLLALKAPKNLLHLTGRPSDDRLTSEIGEVFSVDPNLSRVLCALPQLLEHGMVDQPTHWNRIHMLIRQITSIPGVRLSVSLHPRVDRSEYLRQLSKYDLTVIEGAVADHIPRSQVVIAMGSSIIELALAAAVPVLDLVCWFDHGMYSQAVALVPVKDEGLIGSTLEGVLSAAKYGPLKIQASEQAGYWGQLDGRSSIRIRELMDNLGA